MYSVLCTSHLKLPAPHPPLLGGTQDKLGVFTLFSLDLGFLVVRECTFFSQWLSVLYNAEAEWGFGRDFTCGSQAPLQDWVQVAYSQKTWQFNN